MGIEEPELNVPETFDATDVHGFVAAYAPDLKPKFEFMRWWEEFQKEEFRKWFLRSLFLVAVSLLLFTDLNVWLFTEVIVWGVGTVIFLVLALILSWLPYREGVQKYNSLVAAPHRLQREIAKGFRQDIQNQRESLLGEGTEWATRKRSLTRAKNQAHRSASYFEERQQQDGGEGVIASQLLIARNLHAKLSEASAKIDKQESALLAFFNQCEARVSVLEQGARDQEEIQRLSTLSAKADSVVVDATLALETTGQQLIKRSIQVGQALGSLRRLQLKESAGEVPVDQIEEVADRILESASDDQRMLADLISQVSDNS